MPSPNYVKFQRGSITSYERLVHKDDNTLYFVYDSNNQNTGKLYLGSRLISDNVGGSGVSSLAELSDVLVSSANTGDFLVKNAEGKWAAVNAATVAQSIIEAGGLIAEIDIDENEFQFNSVNGRLELKGYTSASIGMSPVKNANGIIWATPAPDLSTEVGNLTNRISTIETDLASVDGRIANAIANSAHLKYQIIENLSDAINANIIYLIANNSEDNTNTYDEYMFVNSQLEKIGTYGIDLSGYVTTGDLNTEVASQISTLSATQNSRISALETIANNLSNTYVTQTVFNATVGDLSSLNQYNNLDYNTASISDTFEDIYQRLIWQDISE